MNGTRSCYDCANGSPIDGTKTGRGLPWLLYGGSGRMNGYAIDGHMHYIKTCSGFKPKA
jgi:hypothetical protein